MANIINAEASSAKKIEKFSFTKLQVSENDHVITTNPFANKEEHEHQEEESLSPTQQKERQSAAEAELLEKIDQLTSDVVRLQMELEKKEQVHKEALEKAKEEAFEAGKTEALETFQKEMNEEIESLKSQFMHSITVLDEKSHTLETSLKTLEEELLESAFLIARKEVDKHSAQIATLIAQYLLKQIEESSSVTLKVNPEDFTYISNQFKESNIKIESDEAIQKGGVVLLGGEENIDGTILTRYQQALQFLQKES